MTPMKMATKMAMMVAIDHHAQGHEEVRHQLRRRRPGPLMVVPRLPWSALENQIQ